MKKIENVAGTDEAWEAGVLGREEQFVKRTALNEEAEIEAALGMQLISIRFPKRLIEDLKFIAKANDVGYQPLVRDVMERFVAAEIKSIVAATQARAAEELAAREKNTPAPTGRARKIA